MKIPFILVCCALHVFELTLGYNAYHDSSSSANEDDDNTDDDYASGFTCFSQTKKCYKVFWIAFSDKTLNFQGYPRQCDPTRSQ